MITNIVQKTRFLPSGYALQSETLKSFNKLGTHANYNHLLKDLHTLSN